MRLKGKRTVMAAGLSLLLTISPISASAGQLNNGYAQYNRGGVLSGVSVESLKNNTKVQAADIKLDNDLSDWDKVTKRASDVAGIDSWRVAVSSDYSTLYIAYEGTASTQWDYNYAGSNNMFKIKYADGTNDASCGIQFAAWEGHAQAKNAWYADISGAEAVTRNDAHQNTPAPFVLEAAIPMSFFGK